MSIAKSSTQFRTFYLSAVAPPTPAPAHTYKQLLHAIFVSARTAVARDLRLCAHTSCTRFSSMRAPLTPKVLYPLHPLTPSLGKTGTQTARTPFYLPLIIEDLT